MNCRLYLKDSHSMHFLYSNYIFNITQNTHTQLNICIIINTLLHVSAPIRPSSGRTLSYDHSYYHKVLPADGAIGAETCGRVLIIIIHIFYVHVTTHRNKFLYNKTNWWNILVLLESCLQTCMTYTIVECTVNKLLMMDRGTDRNM